MMTADKIRSVIDKYNMVSSGDTVILGVSGGADSMCMLSFFNEYSRKKGFNIVCAHVNHGIRGSEADYDEEFVGSYCSDHGIKFTAAHYDVPKIAAASKESQELCGRRLRYEFFNSIAPNAKIATAHNLNDCMETFLLNLARGTGIKGLCGIPKVQGNIIRPLIECTREEIEAYNAEHGVPFVTDSTNLCDDYTRNKIRHNIIPVLNEINPSFSSVFLNCISSLADTEDYIESVVSLAFSDAESERGFSAAYINALPKAVRDRVILEIARFYGAGETEYKHVSIISDFLEKGGAVTLPGGVTLLSDGEYISKKESVKKVEDFSSEYSPLRSEYFFPDKKLIVKNIDKSEIYLYNNSNIPVNNLIDGEKIKGARFRKRKPGDRFKFPNAAHSKSIKNLFRDKNIPENARDGLIFLADEEHILWIEKIGVSEYAKVTEGTVAILQLQVDCL